tara:strand:- start:302 stop:1420 length:1119 start_codon:yes stop_codon:yes gene_type:complete
MALTTVSSERLSTNVKTTNLNSSFGQLGGRNMIINGSMQCNQRGDQTGISTGQYTLDRWKLHKTNLGTYSVSQLTNSDNEINTGHRFSAKVDCTTAAASPAAGDFLIFQTNMEGLSTNRLCWGTSNAKKAVVSFWAKAEINGFSSGTKDFVFEIQTSDSQEFSVVCQLTANNTWQKFTVPIDAKTSGSVVNDNTNAMSINWWLDAGTNYKGGSGVTGWSAKANSGGVRAAGQTLALGAHTDNNFYLTGVQFEIADPNTTATDFEHRSFEDELRRCQRYYEIIEAHGSGGIAVAIGQGFNTRKGFGYLSFKVTKRVAPTAPNINIAIDQGDTTHDCFFNTTTTGTTIRSSSSTSIGNADITSDGWTNAFSAEF